MNHHDPFFLWGGWHWGLVPLDSQIRGATGSFGAGTHLGGDGATATGDGNGGGRLNAMKKRKIEATWTLILILEVFLGP